MGNKSLCQPEELAKHSSPKLEVETTNNSTENIEN